MLWLPNQVKHRGFVAVLSGVELFLSFAGGFVVVIAVTAHPEGHTAEYASAITFAWMEWILVSAAGIVGAFVFDVAAKTKRAQREAEADKAFALSSTFTRKSIGGNETTNPIDIVDGGVPATHTAAHEFHPDNTPEDPELEIELLVGDDIIVLEYNLDESTDWWKGTNVRTGKTGYVLLTECPPPPPKL